MTFPELRDLVAIMRELGVVHYETPTGIKITIVPEPRVQPAQEAAQSGEPEAEGSGETNVPEAYRRLPVSYRNPALWGGKLPKLDG